MTGLLHADGLADSTDGLLPQVPRERRLEIMADLSVGTYGVVAVVSVLALRVAALAALEPDVLLLAAVWCASRTAMAVAARAVPYARAEGGLATDLLGGPWPTVAATGLGLSVPLAVGAGGFEVLLSVAAGLLASAAVVVVARRRLGGFTGDVLGAAGLVGETVALLAVAADVVSTFAVRAAGAAAGLLADRVLREPPDERHPVAWFGRAMTAVEQRWYADGRLRGTAHAALGVALGAGAGAALRSTAAATAVAAGGRELGTVAQRIGDLLVAGDLDGARAALPSLVGRDPHGLDEKEVARAVVESVAENTVDAVVAPALWAALAGAPGVLAHRAVNTMDAMVGHRDARYERFGWAAARLDDAAAWVPARATAALVAAVRPAAARDVLTTVRRDAPAHPSPNSGVAEAAFAAALGLRLGGVSRYGERIEVRPTLGSGRPPSPADVRAAVRLSADVGSLLAGGLAAAALAGHVTGRCRRAGDRT